MWFDEGDGWRNEDTEGPYIDILRTFYDWEHKASYEISRSIKRHRVNDKYQLTGPNVRMEFNSVEEAKEFVKDRIKQQNNR